MASSAIPLMSRPVAAGRIKSERKPACRSVTMPGEASAFITTTAQRPAATFQVSSCTPGPEEEAAQNFCPAGDAGTAVPGTSRYTGRKGRKFTSCSSVWCTPDRYCSTSSCGAMPIKISLPGCAEEARSLRVPTSKGSRAGVPSPIASSWGEVRA